MTTVELFSMPGCGACGPVRNTLKRLANDLPALTIREIDVTEHPEVAARHQLMACPAVAIDGTVRFVGGVDETRLRAMVGLLT